MKFGFYKLFTVSPKVFIARPDKNLVEHLKALEEIHQKTKDSAVVLFPELSLSSYTAEDMFLNQGLLDGTKEAINSILKESIKYNNFLIAVGAPLEFDGRLYNTAVLMKNGKLLGIVPKRHIVNYGEFYEYRYFSPANGLEKEVELAGQKTILSDKLIFDLDKLKIGVDICEDIFAPIPPSSYATLAGANLIINLSASNEVVGKIAYRKELLSNASARFNCGYLYASAGAMESSRDLIFGGHQLYYENGRLISESSRFNFDTTIMETEIDVEKLEFERRRNKTFGACDIPKMTVVKEKDFSQTLNLTRSYDPHPLFLKKLKKESSARWKFLSCKLWDSLAGC